MKLWGLVFHRLPFLFYFAWGLTLLLQAYATQLFSDEAYYWMYSRQLAWGYFDHPPMIALLIKGGYALVNNELGVRLLTVLAGVVTIYIWQRIISPLDLKLFYSLVISIGIIHFVGFVAIPDAPFLLLASCFFLIYRKFLDHQDLKVSIGMAFTIAAMVLSKYHGILLIGLVVISNVRLLYNKYFWLTAILSAILTTPHLLWQIHAGFPSIRYHLWERSIEPYVFWDTLEYLATQPFILGPLAGILTIMATIRLKAKDQFERALKFAFWGCYLFFLLMTFKGRIEAHWTLFAVIPGVYFAYHFLASSSYWKSMLYRLLLPTIIIITCGRAFLVINHLPDNSLARFISDEFFNKKDWATSVKKLSQGSPVAFMNSYQFASLYEFYSGSKGFSLDNLYYRKSQFDIWNTSELFRGKRVMLVPNGEINGLDSITGTTQHMKYCFIENFQSFPEIRIKPVNDMIAETASDSLQIHLLIDIPPNDRFDFGSNREFPSYVSSAFMDACTVVKEQKLKKLSNDMLHHEFVVRLAVPEKKGRYDLYFTIQTGWLPPTINSRKFELKVK